MPRIRLILEDEQGNRTDQDFALEGDLDTLGQIEQAVEQFKNQALPQVEKTLLEQAQGRFLEREKKTLPDRPW